MVGQDSGIPDLSWINRELPIADVVKALDLRVGEGGKIHCWHPERHKSGDRTASVGIQKPVNRVKCFGCGTRPMSVVDLVMDATGTDAAGAAQWIEKHFEVRRIPKRRHLQDARPKHWCDVGHEQPIELLVKSGIWGALSPQAQRIAPVLNCLATKADGNTFRIQISYRAIMRYSGVKSPNSVAKALKQLAEIEWLKTLPTESNSKVLRDSGTYILTPYSDGITELANSMAAQMRQEIEAERELRKRQRRARRQAIDAATRCVTIKAKEEPPRDAITKYNPLYATDSVVQNAATHSAASNRNGGKTPRLRAENGVQNVPAPYSGSRDEGRAQGRSQGCPHPANRGRQKPSGDSAEC